MSQGKISSLNFRGRGKGTVVTHEKREKNKLIKRVRTTTSPRIKNTIEKRNSSSSINAKRGKESERGETEYASDAGTDSIRLRFGG